MWLFTEITESIETLSNSGFVVRGVVSVNHSINVNAFSILKNKCASNPSDLFISYPYVEKRFMYFNSESFSIHVPGGEISWSLLHAVHDCDESLNANLRKAPKLTYSPLHPGNNKQNVQLALNIFHESTVVSVKSYFPERSDAAQFLKLVGTWWTRTNSSNRYRCIVGHNKVEFLRCFASWLSSWKESSISCEKFTLTSQTSATLTCILNAYASLTEDLLNEGYEFVIPSRL